MEQETGEGWKNLKKPKNVRSSLLVIYEVKHVNGTGNDEPNSLPFSLDKGNPLKAFKSNTWMRYDPVSWIGKRAHNPRNRFRSRMHLWNPACNIPSPAVAFGKPTFASCYRKAGPPEASTSKRQTNRCVVSPIRRRFRKQERALGGYVSPVAVSTLSLLTAEIKAGMRSSQEAFRIKRDCRPEHCWSIISA